MYIAMNFILLASTNPEEITLTLNAVIGLLGGSSVLSVGLAVWIGRIWAKRIAQRDQARLDEQLEAVKTELQKEMKLFEEKLAKERRADDARHKVRGETMERLSQLLVLIGNIETVFLNRGDEPSQWRCWAEYEGALPLLRAHFERYEIPYLQSYGADFVRIGDAINVMAHERNESKAQGRPWTISFSELKEAIKALQRKISAADGV